MPHGKKAEGQQASMPCRAGRTKLGKKEKPWAEETAMTAPSSDLLTRYAGFATHLGVDLVAILVMTYVLYFRRHWRSDLLLSYVALNMGIFVTMSVLGSVRVDIAVGFGLFAILSIIRLRSSAVTQQEVAYYFIALVLGLVNGINLSDRGLLVAMNVVLLVTMLIFDSRGLRERSRRLEVNLKHVYTDEVALTAELERRLGGYVVYQEIESIDLIHHHLTVDVRLRPGPPPVHPVDEPAKTTDKPPADPAAAGGAEEVVPRVLSMDGAPRTVATSRAATAPDLIRPTERRP